ncbi:MAG: caspase family protein [Gallionella sp.]|nr:caspase family protein [Gallionella sp.]
MRRFGLIIANPGEAGEPNYCEGVNKDARNYLEFLCSPAGGAWERSEIQLLEKPSSLDVRVAMIQAKQADYAFIVFAGHGYYSAVTRSTMLRLRPGVEFDSANLRQGASKQTVVLDCCRKIESPQQIVKRAALSFTESVSKRMNAQNCRKHFDREIGNCSSALVVIHSCAINQTAGDDSERGGYYSFNLLEGANDWALGLSASSFCNYSLSATEAHDKAAINVSRLSGGRQTPEIEKPRSAPYFPLAVGAW